MMHPSIKRKTVFGVRPSHLPIRGLRRLGFAPFLADGGYIIRTPGEPDQHFEGPTAPRCDASFGCTQTADGVYQTAPQPDGSTNFTPGTSLPASTPAQVLVGDAGPAQIPSGPQPGTSAYVLAAEQAAEADAVPITYSTPPVLNSGAVAPSGPDVISEVNPALLYPPAYPGSPTTVARSQAAQAATAPGSWFDGSTTLLGFTLSNSTLAIGGVALAGALYFFSGKKGKK